jgi:glutamate-1-semialdehyde 2,1-aminomutase
MKRKEKKNERIKKSKKVSSDEIQYEFEQSKALFEEAKNFIPSGVNSPVRSFSQVQTSPVFARKAKGSEIITEDGIKLSDFIMSWGAIILGHAYNTVKQELRRAMENGFSFGLCHKKEIEFAKILSNSIPGFIFRATNSGTEACMSAVRVARGFTEKKFIIKFSGCFHGHADQFLTQAGSGLATFSIPSSSGVPPEFTSCTITLPFNSPDEILEETFKKYEIAGVILEVIPANMGIVPPEERFIKKLHSLCKSHSAILIYDEVVTGFRISWGGVSSKKKIELIIYDEDGQREISFDVPEPDMVTFGKVIGGGLPIGVFGGRREIMEILAPAGKVYQSGTLSGNPLSLSSGIATLKTISSHEGFYKNLRKKTFELFLVIKEGFSKKGIPVSIVMETGMISVFFRSKVPKNFEEVKNSDLDMFRKFFRVLLKNGVLIPPSPFEAWFISFSHTAKDFEKLSKAISQM